MAFIIYLAGVAGNIQGVFILTAIALGIAGIICLAIGSIEEIPELRRNAKHALIATIACASTAALIPSTTTIYMMVAADMAETQITNPDNQEVFGKVRKLVIQKLDEALDQ